MKRYKLVRILIFLLVGVTIFITIYKNLEFSKIRQALQSLKYEWIILSGVLGLLSHFIRALRWNLLIEPLSHKPGIMNTYLAVLVLYLFNILIPRGGEFARCTVINRYERISFSKLFGTVVSERLADLITFVVILMGLIFWDTSYFEKLLQNNPQLAASMNDTGGAGLFWVTGAIVLAGIVVLILRKRFPGGRYFRLVVKILKQFREGLQTIVGLNRKGLFTLYTFLIIFLWLMMLYVMFFAYEPTSHLSFTTAVVTFAVSSFAFILPIQAGLGAWHFVVIQCLFLFGIDMDQGSLFALIAHTFTNMIFLVFGTIAFILLPVVNSGNIRRLRFRDVAGDEGQGTNGRVQEKRKGTEQ